MTFYQSLFVVVAVSLLSCVGCLQPSEVGNSSVPIVPGARSVDKTVDGARMGDSLNRLEEYTITTWRFGFTSKSMEEVLTFYKEKYPNAEYVATDPNEYDDIPEDEREDEDLIWHSLSQPINRSSDGGSKSDDTLDILIGDDFFLITECVKD